MMIRMLSIFTFQNNLGRIQKMNVIIYLHLVFRIYQANLLMVDIRLINIRTCQHDEFDV